MPAAEYYDPDVGNHSPLLRKVTVYYGALSSASRSVHASSSSPSQGSGESDIDLASEEGTGKKTKPLKGSKTRKRENNQSIGDPQLLDILDPNGYIPRGEGLPVVTSAPQSEEDEETEVVHRVKAMGDEQKQGNGVYVGDDDPKTVDASQDQLLRKEGDLPGAPTMNGVTTRDQGRKPSKALTKPGPPAARSTLNVIPPPKQPLPSVGERDRASTPLSQASHPGHQQSAQLDGSSTRQPIQANGPFASGTFKCEYAGCTALPFQTQYFLSSHANVHSSNRPHFCPVADCPRGPGGKGFKRKNEMIRHGLVHQSPGYICPFCPDQQHRYPRPDNLQRHVRVRHVEKDKDDPQLRVVLAQRPESDNRGKRRRAGG